VPASSRGPGALFSGDRVFIVGAQRCGTTYLYHLLDRHPEIEMARPVRPEPKFFLDEARYARGLAQYDAAYFTGKPGARLRGEKGTSYLESELAADRIAAAFPEARIVVLVRDPVARAISHWRFSVENGVETLPLEEALRREAERRDTYDRARFSVSPFAYLKRGRYVDDIAVWERRFPRPRIRVLVSEHFLGSAEAVRDLFVWLGVGPGFRPEELDRAVNVSDAPHGLSAALPPSVAAELAAHFRETNRRLAERYGLDLTPWQGEHAVGSGR
jgi:Sulfotransferase domain